MAGDVLYEPGERIRDVYFPTQSVVSLVAKAGGDASLEVALVSDEGMIGIPLLLGGDSKPLRVLVQSSGTAWRMQAETFKRMTDTQQALREALNKYALARLAQVAQNAICANAHSTEARLARRLLMMQDRSHSDEIRATQDSLASMLGVRRTTVTLLAISFQQRNIIQYVRGTVTVLDRSGLKKISCECYQGV
jgi:CRP-like cAMP-binding protein